LREVIGQITRLNPKPGGNVETGIQNSNYIIPDFFVVNNNGKLELTVKTLPICVLAKATGIC
jgi:RNA polymerase sigma-54 factor